MEVSGWGGHQMVGHGHSPPERRVSLTPRGVTWKDFSCQRMGLQRKLPAENGAFLSGAQTPRGGLAKPPSPRLWRTLRTPQLDRQEAEIRAEQRRIQIERANKILFDETDRVKGFHSKMLLSDVMHENEQLKEIKRQIEVLKRAQEQAFVEQQRQALEVSGHRGCCGRSARCPGVPVCQQELCGALKAEESAGHCWCRGASVSGMLAKPTLTYPIMQPSPDSLPPPSALPPRLLHRPRRLLRCASWRTRGAAPWRSARCSCSSWRSSRPRSWASGRRTARRERRCGGRRWRR